MKTCVIVPNYNSWDSIGSIVADTTSMGMTVLVVDDGSNAKTRDAIDYAVNGRKDAFVIHRQTNGGKGAAIVDGVHWAHDHGFTHFVQIDADGQHATEDILRLVSSGSEHPESMVLGTPVFPDNVPKARLYGRRISVFWVALETLSRQIKDPLFGLRLYPVASVLNVLSKYRLGLRMDFDPELVVRLCWEGVPVINVDAKVVYRNDGTSNFRMFRDNVRISFMHARLFIGMLWRAPIILWRRWRVG